MPCNAFEPYTTATHARLTFRPALQADIPRIARLHDAIWHYSHRGLLPAQIPGSAEYERSLWPQDGCGVRLIAERAGEIAGFGIGGPARNSLLGAGVEIQSLYVRPSLRFRGIGTALISSLAQRLAIIFRMRQAGVVISALNVAGVAFARALGAVVERRAAIGQAIASGSLATTCPRVALVWHDIDKLAFHTKRRSVKTVSF